MSEIKTLEVEVTHPDILDVDVDFGQTLTKIVAPEHYMGPFEFHVSDEDQVIPVKEKTPTEDIVVKAEEWDGILYPVTDDPDKVFDAKWIPVRDGDTIIVEGYGRGRWVGTNGNDKIDPNTLQPTLNFNALPSPFFSKIRFVFTVKTLTDDACVILAGYQWARDGTHSTNSAYQFRGEYLKWKIIPAE